MYWKQHPEDGIVDVGSRRCLHDACTKQPCVSLEGNKAAHCKKHAEGGTVNVQIPWCSCRTRPIVNFIGRKRAYCKLHADDGMVDALARRSSRSPNDASMFVEAPRRAPAANCTPTDGMPTVRVQLKKEISADPVTSMGVLRVV